MTVILRTHGGLGNQLFQVLYGRLFAEKFDLDLKEIHDAHYKNAFPRTEALLCPTLQPTPLERWISALRLPKVVQRVRRGLDHPVWLLGTAYLDGYFQDAAAYDIFTVDALRRQLRQLRSELLIGPGHIDQCLVHLRVGDFFKSRKDAAEHVIQRLSTALPNSAIITNDEALLEELPIALLLDQKRCTLVPTAGFSAEKVLRLMAAYRRLDANDSTLVFWASLLGGCQTTLRNARLNATHEFFERTLGQTM